MALVSSSFAERYAELTSRVPTPTERLLDVQRNELYGRREVEAQAQAAFQDVLHVAAIMIADKKARQRGSNALMDKHAVALRTQETAVWFPAAPPRAVPFRANRPLRAFPHAAFAEMCDEERELRQWLYGVERRLRQHIEEAGSRSYFYLNVMEDTVSLEYRGRQRLLREEDETYVEVKQRFFRTVPADYFRHVVLARYGASVPAPIEAIEDNSIEGQEEKARAALYKEEVAACKDVFQYLQTAYDVRLFALNHREVIERYELEQMEANELFPLIAARCRADFGGTFYHVPAVALHLGGAACACLRALCMAQLQRTTPVPVAVAAAPSVPIVEEAGHAMYEEEEMRDVAAVEATQNTYPSFEYTCKAGAPPTVEDTCNAMPTPPPEFEDASAEGVTAPSPTSAKQKKEKEWEVNTDPTPGVLQTLYSYEDDQPVVKAVYTIGQVSFAQEEEAAHGEAEVAADAAVTLSHNNSELTFSPQPLPTSIFSCEEIFVGDPFAESPKKSKKEKKAKKSKKSSKSKRSKADGA